MTPEMALEMVPDIGTIIDQVAVKVQLEIGRKNWKLVAVIYRRFVLVAVFILWAELDPKLDPKSSQI